MMMHNEECSGDSASHKSCSTVNALDDLLYHIECIIPVFVHYCVLFKDMFSFIIIINS